nr:PREDICTED: auxin-responsive protein SAUR36-like [Musa acuminata subsp. malaccensis]
MLSARRLLEITRKWQKMATLGRKRISWPRRAASTESKSKSTSIADRGHFIVYSTEGKRFAVPFFDTKMFQLTMISQHSNYLASKFSIKCRVMEASAELQNINNKDDKLLHMLIHINFKAHDPM